MGIPGQPLTLRRTGRGVIVSFNFEYPDRRWLARSVPMKVEPEPWCGLQMPVEVSGSVNERRRAFGGEIPNGENVVGAGSEQVPAPLYDEQPLRLVANYSGWRQVMAQPGLDECRRRYQRLARTSYRCAGTAGADTRCPRSPARTGRRWRKSRSVSTSTASSGCFSISCSRTISEVK